MSPPSFPTQLAFSPWRGAVPTVPGVPGVVPVVAAASPVTTTPTSVAQEMGLWEPLEPGAFQRIPLLEDTMKNQPTSPRIPRVSSFFFKIETCLQFFLKIPWVFCSFGDGGDLAGASRRLWWAIVRGLLKRSPWAAIRHISQCVYQKFDGESAFSPLIHIAILRYLHFVSYTENRLIFITPSGIKALTQG